MTEQYKKNNFSIKETSLNGVFEIEPFYSEDRRGTFYKTYNSQLFHDKTVNYDIKEIFFAESKKGVLRGLHFQLKKQQRKLVQCVKGNIYDVVVDLNPQSPTFKKWQGFDLNGSNLKALLIPRYCAHGYYAKEDSIVCYMCDEIFFQEGDSGIRWDDPTINIDWNIDSEPILSDKDEKLMSFVDYLTKISDNQ